MKNKIIKNLEKYFESNIFESDIDEYIEKINNENKIVNYQLKRFHNKFKDKENFSDFVNKVRNKYYSDKYRKLWFKKGIEPREDLFWFLYEYALEYGRECNKIEWEKYANCFTTELFFINDYYISRVDGQGSLINISKKY